MDTSTIVYVVVLDPQGSMGGFEWFMDEDGPEAWIERHKMRDLTLGTVRVKINGGAGMTNDEITDEIDARLGELERNLGYAPKA
jgi:hypothetical protein